MTSKEMPVDNPLEELLLPDFSAKRIYAYSLKLEELTGRIKVGETERQVRSRVKEQVNTAGLSDVGKRPKFIPVVAGP